MARGTKDRVLFNPLLGGGRKLTHSNSAICDQKNFAKPQKYLGTLSPLSKCDIIYDSDLLGTIQAKKQTKP